MLSTGVISNNITSNH